MRTFWPFIRLLNGTGQAVVNLIGLRGSGRHALVHSEEELKMLVTASQEAGVLEEQEEQMLHRVFAFGDLTAGQVMMPRTEIVAIPANISRDELVPLVVRSGHPRLPVYRKNLDNVVGILYITDLLKALTSPGGDVSVATLAREALAVPETLGADDLLAEMRRRGVREALVFDEYGGTAGLVTFESLMARIVGDLGPGFGSSATITVLDDGTAQIDGLVLVTDVNERFALQMDETTYTTVGGFVLGQLGRQPRVGDTIEVDSRQMRVEALDGLRVARVWLSKPGQKVEPPASHHRGHKGRHHS
jgi:CBS domain containing-hemolysin-like protein